MKGQVPVIAVDGPSGSGKGTLASELATETGFHLLDSGAIYRAGALWVLQNGVDLDDAAAVEAGVANMQARFEPAGSDGVRVFLAGSDVSDRLRQEDTASAASRIAAMPGVRQALLDVQRDFRRPPGLVADGRDMGTTVFPDAELKVFLTASAEERAQRRYKQLKSKGLQVTLESLLQDIELRDQRDSSRSTSPLKPADDALVIDSTGKTIESVIEEVHLALRQRGLLPL